MTKGTSDVANAKDWKPLVIMSLMSLGNCLYSMCTYYIFLFSIKYTWQSAIP